MSVGVITGCSNVPNAPLYRLELSYNGKCQSISLGDVLEAHGPLGSRGVFMKVTGWHQIGPLTHPEVEVVHGLIACVVPGDDLRHMQPPRLPVAPTLQVTAARAVPGSSFHNNYYEWTIGGGAVDSSWIGAHVECSDAFGNKITAVVIAVSSPSRLIVDVETGAAALPAKLNKLTSLPLRPFNGFTYGGPPAPVAMPPSFNALLKEASDVLRTPTRSSCECGAEKALGAKPGQPGHSSWCPAK